MRLALVVERRAPKPKDALVSKGGPTRPLPVLARRARRTEMRIARVERCAVLEHEAAARTSAGYVVEPDRRAAIALALNIAASGDIVVIAGKGHEDYQLVGSQRLDFDDRVVVQELMSQTSAV